jgi:hypothetical protein
MRLNTSVLRMIGAAVMALALGFGSTVKPAAADQAAATRNEILGVAAAIAIGLTAANVAHKNAVANTVQGYLPDGSTVYGNGEVVTPNGQSYYPGNYGQQVSCNGGYCGVSGNGAYNNGYNNGYNNSYNNGYNNGAYGYNPYGGYGYGQRYARR